jgi:orotate phosphoribosyltransferase
VRAEENGDDVALSEAGMDEDELIAELEETGALKKGHFRLSSGRHSDTYIQCALLLMDPRRAVKIGESLAAIVKDGDQVDIVLSPALGALLIGFTVALSMGRPMLFAERVEGDMQLRRGLCLPSGARVLIVEDVVTTGGSVMELVRIVEESQATVHGIACIINRAQHQLEGYSVTSLLDLEADSFEEEECPQCLEGTEIDSPGSRFIGGTS